MESGNYAPIILSNPVELGRPNKAYTYQLKAIDPDLDTLTYSLVTAPDGMTIDSSTGLINWATPVTSSTQKEIAVQVQDSRGGIDTQQYQLFWDAEAGEISGKVYTNDVLPLGADIPVTAITTADNYFSLYYGNASGSDLTYVGGGDNWPSAFKYNFNLKPDDYLYAVAWNLPGGSPRMWLGEFDLPDGVKLLSNDSDWVNKVGSGINPFYLLPSTTQLNQDISQGTWLTPQQSAPNLPGQVWGQNYQISEEAEFIWSDSFYAPSPTDEHYVIFKSATPVGTYLVNHSQRGLEGQTVYLDINTNSQLDLNEPSTVTDVQGNYSFTVSEGSYSVKLADLSGWSQFFPTNNNQVTVNSGESESGINFGRTQTKPHSTNSNSAPVFNSQPLTDAEAGQKFLYQSIATDNDEDSLIYDLAVKPDGMTVDPVTGFVRWRPTSTQVGQLQVVLRVQDSYGGVALQSFTVNVTPTINPPVFTTNDLAVVPVVGKTFTYQFQAIDPQGSPVSYQLDSTEPNATIDANTGLFSWTPNAIISPTSYDGIAHFGVTVLNELGRKSTTFFELIPTLNNDNAAPVITSNPRITTASLQPYLYQVVANDPNNNLITYSLENAPSGMTINNLGQIEWTPSANQLGTNNISIKVEDGQGGTVNQNYQLQVVNPSNLITQPPVITSSPPSTNAVVDVQYRYTPKISNPDNNVVVFALDKAPVGMVIDQKTGTLLWTPTIEQLGDHEITVRALSSLGGTNIQTFTLFVQPVNVPSVITSTANTIASVGKLYTYAVTATDAENHSLNYSLLQAPTGMSIDATNGLISWIPVSTQQGLQEIKLAVDDGLGGITTQSYSVQVAASAANNPPKITSAPVGTAAVDQVYKYQFIAIDPEGGNLTYTIAGAPVGMSISPTGLVQWTPTAAQVGNYAVKVIATDSAGAAAVQGFNLNTIVNLAPVVQTQPLTTVTVGNSYRYDIKAIDQNADALSFSIKQAPAEMTLDTFGRIRWNPTTNNIGVHPIILAVTDSRGATSLQTYQLTVAADTMAPQVSLLATQNTFDIGDVATFVVKATDNVAVKNLQLLVDGQPLAIDNNGLAKVSISHPGKITAIATAIDAAGNVGSTSTEVIVLDPNDINAPVISLDLSAITNGTITAPTNIIGTVTDSNLAEYILEVAPVGSEDFVKVFEGNSDVTDGVLGKFDPSLLENDTYTVRLTAFDTNNQGSVVEDTISVAGDLKLGNFKLSFTDLSVPVTGIPISLTRTYDTLTANTTDDFGYGWRMEFRDTDLRTSLGRDRVYEELGVRSLAFKDGTRVYLTLPGGKREGFTFRPQPARTIDGQPLGIFSNYMYAPEFVPDKGVTDKLTVQNAYLTKGKDGRFYGLNMSGYNPVDDSAGFGGYYQLTTKEGIEYRVDALTGDLQTVTDTNGNKLTYSDAGIVSSTGKSITFERDAAGRIAAVKDPMGELVRYQYDTAGDLVGVTDRDANTTQFEYNGGRAHYLDQIIDPLGREAVKTEYDELGRLKKIFDADGNPVEMVYDPENSLQTVKDALGNPTTYEYDERGNVVTEIDAVGKVTKSAYDEDNNLLSETIISDRSGATGFTTKYT
ncbi:MAG: putative Ig domain-containing protein, partial [Crinalium sp.]